MLKENVTRRGGLQVKECLNLRLKRGTTDVLEPVGPARQVAEHGWEPLFRDGSRLLVTESGSLRIGWASLDDADRPSGDPMVTVIGELPAGAGAVFADGDTLTVMTGCGQWLLRRGDGVTEAPYIVVGSQPDWPDIAVTAEPGTVMQRIIDGGDVTALEDAYVGAYRSLAEDLGTVREYMQPVVVRCQLLDAAGGVLHVTPPVCVMPSGGAQLATTLHVPVSEGQHNGCVVEVCGFRLRVTLCGGVPDEWVRRVASLRVLATPQFHCCDMEGKAAITIARRTGETSAVVTANATLPGLSRGVNAANIGCAVALFDSLAREVAVIDRPFASGSPGTWTVDAPPVADVPASAKKFWNALNASVSGARTQVGMLSVPHTYTAVLTAENGGRRIFGGITRFAWRGYGAAAFAASDTRLPDAAVSGTVRVVMDDGSVIQSVVHMAVTPSQVGPLLSYPDPRARRLTLTAGSAGISVDLRPDASGSCAYWVAPGCRPVPMGTDFDAEATSGEETRLSAELPGHLAVTRQGVVEGCGFVAHDIRALLPARSSGGAWDFGRSRFYVFTGSDTRMLTVSPTAMSASLIDSRGIAAPYGVCAAGNSVYMLSGTSLLRLDGSRVSAVPGIFDCDRIGYDPARDELVLANPDDNEAMVISAVAGTSYTVSLVLGGGEHGWLVAGGSIFALTGDGLRDLNSRYCRISETVNVRWSAVNTGVKPSPVSVRAVSVPVSCSRFEGTVTVGRSWLGRSASVRRIDVRGAIRSPLRTVLALRPAIDLRLTVQGTVSPDFEMSAPLFSV